jgi:hypothetical protein
MKRLSIWIVAMGLLGGACAGVRGGSLGRAPTAEPPGPSGPAPSEHPSATPTETPSSEPTRTPRRKVTFQVWFASEGGRLFLTRRTEPFSPAVAGLALRALLAGPTADERAAGVTSAIPAGTSGRITALAGGVATVRVSDGFFAGDPGARHLREAQVVYTLTQYPTIRRVQMAGEGGEVLVGPRGRNAYQDVLPLIVVESPTIGARVSNPVTVSGIANVFEATVSLRILDAAGDEVARTFTTATCGTGCWGEYSVSVPYSVDREQAGTIEVFESSAEDGSMINVVRIPVTLTP